MRAIACVELAEEGGSEVITIETLNEVSKTVFQMRSHLRGME